MTSKPRTKIFTHLWYAENAEEAAYFYTTIFPDSRVDRVTPLLSETPSGPPGSVKVVDFTILGQRFQAITAGPHHELNDAISIVVLCDDQEELMRDSDPARSKRVTDAMLTMIKLDISAIEKAAAGS